jgi:5-methyltetrahydrofolate--homocysteine methyltransferase
MTPNFIGQKTIEVDLEVLVPYIDWTPFLEHGNCLVNILLFLLMMLLAKKRLPFCRCAGNVKVILKEKKLTAKGIYGIFSESS